MKKENKKGKEGVKRIAKREVNVRRSKEERNYNKKREKEK